MTDMRFVEVTELGEACRRGDIDRVRELLLKHPDALDSPDRDERFSYPESRLWSPLYMAAMNGHEELVNVLLEKGANPAPYEVAAQYHEHTYWGWMDALQERGFEPIVRAIEAALRERYGPLLDAANIRQAVADGDIERVRTLIAEKPERVRQVDAVGNTPLHIAVAASNLDMTRLLIECGAPVDARNGDGRTPGVVALFGLHRYWRDEAKPEILNALLRNGAQYTLLIAATVGDEARVREFVEADPSSANGADPCRRRPLSGAVSGGHAAVVRLLLEHGADPNAKEAICQGGLSLRTAAAKGDGEIVRLLLEHGAVPGHWVDSSGDAMYAAHAGGHSSIVQMLYAYGGTMELQVYAAQYRIDVIAEVLRLQPSKANDVLPYGWDDNGNEQLAYDIMQLAIRYGARFENASAWNLRWTALKYPSVFRLLQRHGANPDAPLLGMAGDRSRRYKSEEARLGAIAFLVEECGANVNCCDEEGFTPLAKAAREGQADVVDYLLSRGAGINAKAPEWAQPLYLAEKRGHAAIVERLRRHGLTG